jgi:DNA polymerase-3 subunit delta
MTFGEFQKTLAAGTVPPVVLFHGSEPYLASLGVALLRKRLIAPGSDAFDFVSLTGRDATAEAIAAHASTAPMLSERRLTVVYEFDALTPSQRAKLVAYLDRPVQSSCLALVSFELLSRGTRFERDVLSRCAVVECGRVAGKTLDALVGRMARERGRDLDEGALAALVGAVDGSLGRVASELDKLACFVPEGRPIGRADVEEAVGLRASGVTDLAVAVAAGDLGRALTLADELIDQGLEAAQLVSQMWSHWVGLWSARAGAGGATGATGRVWDGVENAAELARRRTSREYAAGVRSFLRADTDIRKGAAGPATVAALLYDLTRGAP